MANRLTIALFGKYGEDKGPHSRPQRAVLRGATHYSLSFKDILKIQTQVDDQCARQVLNDAFILLRRWSGYHIRLIVFMQFS